MDYKKGIVVVCACEDHQKEACEFICSEKTCAPVGSVFTSEDSLKNTEKVSVEEVPAGPAHYDNTHGSLYKIAQERGWNAYQFDIVKRIDRALKKGNFTEDLEKTKVVIDIWLKELKHERKRKSERVGR
jgi:hypothetical protein